MYAGLDAIDDEEGVCVAGSPVHRAVRPLQCSDSNAQRMQEEAELARSSLLFGDSEPRTFGEGRRKASAAIGAAPTRRSPLALSSSTCTASGAPALSEGVGGPSSAPTHRSVLARALQGSDSGEKEWQSKMDALESRVIIDFAQLHFTRKLGGSVREVWKARLWDMEVAVRKLRVHCGAPDTEQEIHSALHSSYSSTVELSRSHSIRSSLEELRLGAAQPSACDGQGDGDHVCPEVAAELALLK